MAQYTENQMSKEQTVVVMPDIVARMSWAVSEISDMRVDFPEWFNLVGEQIEVLETCLLILKEFKP